LITPIHLLMVGAGPPSRSDRHCCPPGISLACRSCDLATARPRHHHAGGLPAGGVSAIAAPAPQSGRMGLAPTAGVGRLSRPCAAGSNYR